MSRGAGRRHAVPGVHRRRRYTVEKKVRLSSARLYSKHWPPGPEMDADIDRHWHVVAAQLEAGLIAEYGAEIVPSDIDRERAAVRDWLERHPDHVILPRRLR